MFERMFKYFSETFKHSVKVFEQTVQESKRFAVSAEFFSKHSHTP